MSIAVKICGLRDSDAVAATVAGGARYAGFVFYPPSPRAITPEQAAPLINALPASILPVGLFVNPTDEEIIRVLQTTPLRLIQLHGAENPQRVAEVKRNTGLPVIKAIGIATAQDIMTAHLYESVADLLLLDAKAPDGTLPGGNALAFEWGLLKGLSLAIPWLLAGGLTPDNIAAAVAVTGARMLDVSSGVESAVGQKSPAKIKAFLEKAAQIETCC